MTDIDAFSPIIDAAETHGEALVVYDLEDRVAFANAHHRSLYEAIDFDRRPRFTDIFWYCVEARKFSHPRVYVDPEAWLADTLRNRLLGPSLRFLRRHRDGRVFVIKNVRVDGVGSYQTRTALSQDMVNGIPEFSGFSDPPLAANTDPVSEVASLRSRVTEMTVALDAWRTPCLVADEEGRIRHFNQAMSLLLDREDGLRIHGPKLLADRNDDQMRLLAAIKRYANTRTGLALATMRIRRNSGLSPFVASISATMPGLSPLPFAETQSALVLVADPDAGCAVDARTLQQLYGLTALQAELATKLIRAESLKKIASAMKMQVEIVEAAVEELMDRMGVDSHIAFTQRMTDIAAIINPHRSPGW